MLRFAISTRSLNQKDFLANTLTGQSLVQMSRIYSIHLDIAYNASSGLAAVYNPVIESASPSDVLVFMHDDVLIHDWHLPVRLNDALAQFDVVGVMGNAQREPMQVGWWGKMVDDEHSGVSFSPCGVPKGSVMLAHSNKTEFWSNEPHSVQSLDGLFLAAKASVLQQHHIRFDALFQYHMYDIDFCRQCELKGVKMGVWPIALSHKSEGKISQEWYDAGLKYLEKWQD